MYYLTIESACVRARMLLLAGGPFDFMGHMRLMRILEKNISFFVSNKSESIRTETSTQNKMNNNDNVCNGKGKPKPNRKHIFEFSIWIIAVEIARMKSM